MNLLFLNSARRGWGGNEKWISLAVSGMRRRHNVSLAYRDPAIARRIEAETHRLPFRHELDIETISRLVALIRTKDIDILIPTKQKEYLLAGIAAKLTGCRVVFRLGIVRPLKNPIQTYIFNHLAHGIIVNAEAIKKALTTSGLKKPGHVKVIYNGIDSAIIHKQSCVEKPRLPFDFILTGLGELSPRKGFHLLLHAFASFALQYPESNAGLVIIGEGEMHRELHQQARNLGIEKKVVFTGFLENPYPYLASGDVFVMPSSSEGISNALLEAALLDNAIVTGSSGGGITEVFEHNRHGLLVDIDEDDTITEAISLLYTTPELRRSLAKNAKTQVLKTFSLENMTTSMETFCTEVLKHSS
jgi:glycosyltransferase involved in cell wall biosynthesis